MLALILVLGALSHAEAPQEASISWEEALRRDRGQRLAEARGFEGRSQELRAGAGALVATLIHEVDHTDEVLRVVMDILLPAAEERLGLTHLAFDAGGATVLDLLVAQQEVVNTRIQAHRAEAARAFARIRLALFLEAAR